MAKGNQQKFGRAKRRPTHAGQQLRSARNKRLHVEKAARQAAATKSMKVARGTARAKRRISKQRKAA